MKIENNLGLAYEAMNQMDPAVAAYRQAIEWQDQGPHDKLSEQPLLNLGIVLLHRGELTEAHALLTKASALAPEDPGIHEQLGHLYLQKADYVAAEEELQKACGLDPKSSSLHFLLGQAYRHLGKLEEAKAEFADLSAAGEHFLPMKSVLISSISWNPILILFVFSVDTAL